MAAQGIREFTGWLVMQRSDGEAVGIGVVSGLVFAGYSIHRQIGVEQAAGGG